MPNTFHINKNLLQLVSSGNEKAFRFLFDHYKDRFYAVALKMVGNEMIAEETVQEVFIQIWKQRESLSEVDNPDSYFFTVVYRQIYRHYKQIALERKVSDTALTDLSSPNFTDEILIAKESERRIHEAISKLPPQQQLIFKLSKHEGFSRNQIAEKLNISPNTVRNHLAEAVKTIRLYLKDLALIVGIFLSNL